MISRRAVLAGGIGGAALAASTVSAGIAGLLPWQGYHEPDSPSQRIPSAPEGVVRLTTKYSDARGQQVGLFSAVPAGHGSGAGLPVCLILHGASATTADFRKFGFARFLTAAISAGIPPFVLVGADGGRSYWEGDGKTDEPQRMLTEELPRWCTDQNFDTTRMAAYGWSMGGHGALLWAAGKPNQTAARCLLA